MHLLLFLHPDNKYPSSDDIDHIISAEIPSHENDPELYILVQNHMVHGPCGILQPKSPCMKKGEQWWVRRQMVNMLVFLLDD